MVKINGENREHLTDLNVPHLRRKINKTCANRPVSCVNGENPSDFGSDKETVYHCAAALGRRACPLSLAPLAKAGLRLPASASLPLASCWPRPQQLLPASATGGGRRRCPQRGSPWQAGPLPTGRLSPDMAQKGGPCYRGQRLLDKRTLSSCREPRQRSTTVPETSSFACPA